MQRKPNVSPNGERPARRPVRRIARPESLIEQGAWDAINRLEGPPWRAHPWRIVAREFGISALSRGDWAYQGRSVPEHEDPTIYPRVKGLAYRRDRLSNWLCDLSGLPRVELWRQGAEYASAMLGVPEVKCARELDDYIIQLQRSGALEQSLIMPAVWPFRPYADRPFETDPRFAYDDDQS